MSKPLSIFKRAICLCLDLRANEWDALEEQVEELGGHMEKFIVGRGQVLPKEAYSLIDDVNRPMEEWSGTYTKNAFFCYHSHRALLQEILDSDPDQDNMFLLMEDDCEFMEGFAEVAQLGMEQIAQKNLNPSLMYLSSNNTWGRTEEVSPNVLRLLGGSYCWHAIGIRASIIPHLLSLPKSGPFDYLSSIYTQPKYECLSLWPNLAQQRSGYSNVNSAVQDYSNYLLHKGNA